MFASADRKGSDKYEALSANEAESLDMSHLAQPGIRRRMPQD